MISIPVPVRRALPLCLLLGSLVPAARAGHAIALAPEAPVLPGMGIDLVTGELKQPCVAWDRIEEVSTGQGTTFRYELAEDSAGVKKALGVKASAAYANPLSHVSAKASFASEVNANSYSLYVLAVVDVQAPTPTLAGVRLKPEVITLLAGPDGLARFRRVCGDEYIGALNRSGSFLGVIEIQTRDGSEKRATSVSLSGRMRAVEGSGELTKAVAEVSRRHQVRSFQHVTGQQATSLSVSPAELVRNAELFPTRVTAASAQPYQAQTFAYDSLIGWQGPHPTEVAHQARVVGEIGRRDDEFRATLADLEYVLANPLQFQAEDRGRLLAMRAALHRNMDRLQQAARRCHRDLGACAFPSGLEDEQLHQGQRRPLPPRRESLCYATKEDPACGVAQHESRRDPLCGVEAYASRRDPECGVELYEEARSPACGVELYKQRTDFECGYTLGPVKACVGCLECWDGYEKVGAKLMRLECRKKLPKTCRKPRFGIERYKSCRHPDHGPERFASCARERFGVAAYKECAREKFGVARYLACARPEFGLVDCDPTSVRGR